MLSAPPTVSTLPGLLHTLGTNRTLPITFLLLYTFEGTTRTSPGPSWPCHRALSIVHILFTPAKEPRPCRSAGWGWHKARAGHLKSSSTKSALSSPQFPDSQGENRWEHSPSPPGKKFSVTEQLRLQQSRVYMCKHAHTMLMSKYSQMQMTSRLSLIIVFSSPWFSCGGGLRTIGDLGGWRGAKDNCGLGIFTSWTMRPFFRSRFSFLLYPFRSCVLACWGLQVPDLETANPDCIDASIPATESQCKSEQQFEMPGILPLTACTHLPQFPPNFEGSGLLLFAPFEL